MDSDPEKFFRQASMTADEYLRQAIGSIDAKFGAGYAKATPDLVAAFMEVAGNDCNFALLAHAQTEAANIIAPALLALAEEIAAGGAA